jgi:hypothetical protein
MALSAQEASIIQQELYVFLTGSQAPGIRSVMRAAGYSGHAAKITDVEAEFVTALDHAYGQAAPTISP